MEIRSSSPVDRNDKGDDEHRKGHSRKSYFQCMNSTRLMVLVILCLQNSMFTVLRRYSQGVLQEVYSKVSAI